MTRAETRAYLNSSNLTRFLTENGMSEPAPTQEDVGQQLGDWLNFKQAIALHGVLSQDALNASSTQSIAAPMPPEALRRHVEKVRTALEQSISEGAPTGSGLTRIEMPKARLDEPIDLKAAFEPYRRFHAAHQRQMEQVIRPLRSQVRGHMTNAPALKQLAHLDAEFENMLQERETALLGKVTKLFEKRFTQALKQHIKKQNETLHQNLSADLNSLAWLSALHQDLKAALLAELDTRLQPTFGLLEAYHQEYPQEK